MEMLIKGRRSEKLPEHGTGSIPQPTRKMNVLCVSIPEYGHVTSLVTLAAALREHGHVVSYASLEEARARVAKANVPFISLGSLDPEDKDATDDYIRYDDPISSVI